MLMAAAANVRTVLVLRVKFAVPAELPMCAVSLARLPAAVRAVLIIAEILATLNAIDSLMVLFVMTRAVSSKILFVKVEDGGHLPRKLTLEVAKAKLAAPVQGACLIILSLEVSLIIIAALLSLVIVKIP